MILESDNLIIKEYCEQKTERSSTAFVRKYQSFVYSVAFRILKNSDDAQDAAQETFIRALKNLHTFRQQSSLQTWLYRIVTNVSLSMKRKKKIYSFFSFEDKEILPEETVLYEDPTSQQKIEEKEYEVRLLKLLDLLPPKQREVFCLRYFDELPYETISEMLGTTVGGLKANYHQALKKITTSIESGFFSRILTFHGAWSMNSNFNKNKQESFEDMDDHDEIVLSTVLNKNQYRRIAEQRTRNVSVEVNKRLALQAKPSLSSFSSRIFVFATGLIAIMAIVLNYQSINTHIRNLYLDVSENYSQNNIDAQQHNIINVNEDYDRVYADMHGMFEFVDFYQDDDVLLSNDEHLLDKLIGDETYSPNVIEQKIDGIADGVVQ